MRRGSVLTRTVVLSAVLVLTTSSVAIADSEVLLVKATHRYGLSEKVTGTWGSVAVDYNTDGWPDLFVGRHGAHPFFYENGQGVYERRRYELDFPKGYDAGDGDTWVDRHSCAWGEATGGGRLDLYCGVGANEGTSVGPNQLLVWDGDGFKDAAKHRGLKEKYGRSRTVHWMDYDVDGDLDVYVGNWARPSYPSVMYRNMRGRFERKTVGVEDQLRTHSSSWADWDSDGDPDLLVLQYLAPAIAYENQGRRFVRVTIPHVTGGSWHGSAWGDFNADGRPDLHLINDTRSLILKNQGGSFTVEDDRSAREGRAGGWLDVENDGDLDLFVVQGAPGKYPSRDAVNAPDVLLVRRGGKFVQVRRSSFRGPESGSGDSVSVSDFDRDGRQDLFVTNGFFEYEQWIGKSWLLQNQTDAANWVGIRLVGKRWNPSGVGALLRVETVTDLYRRRTNDGVTFRSQSEIGYAHFGIADALEATVKVTWPQGGSDCAVAASGVVVVVEQGQTPC